ncbi:MAG: hypothetical protein IPH03_09110 [Tetrasphaera sp.]|nr:hypothetical protein [Tetrasphaera sp.]
MGGDEGGVEIGRSRRGDPDEIGRSAPEPVQRTEIRDAGGVEFEDA